jgi:hypothetical protein
MAGPHDSLRDSSRVEVAVQEPPQGDAPPRPSALPLQRPLDELSSEFRALRIIRPFQQGPGAGENDEALEHAIRTLAPERKPINSHAAPMPGERKRRNPGQPS